MPRYNAVSQILLILTVISFTLAAPVLVLEKREACVDELHIPRDVITVLGKRAVGDDLGMLWDGPRRFENVWGEPEEEGYKPLPAGPDQEEVDGPEVHGPQPNPAEEDGPEVHGPQPNPAEVHVPEVHALPPDLLVPLLAPEGRVPPPNLLFLPEVGVHAPNLAGAHVPEVDMPPVPRPEWGPPESDSESMEFGDDAPPRSPESTTESEYWTPPSSPRAESSTEPYSAL